MFNGSVRISGVMPGYLEVRSLQSHLKLLLHLRQDLLQRELGLGQQVIPREVFICKP
jgi:hypothetical protein